MPRAATSADSIAIAERRAMALDARKQGYNYVQIAEYMRQQEGVSPGYNKSQAYKDVVFELRRIIAESSETAAEVLRLHLERYDALLTAWWPKAVDEERLDGYAFDKVVSIMGKVEALLSLNRPTQVTVSGPNSGPVEVKFDVSGLPAHILRAIAYETGDNAPPGGGSPPPSEDVPG